MKRMIHSKNQKIIFVIAALFILLVVSCRKKDERYEGTYTGVERRTYLDSGETVFSIDTTYIQEFIVTYDNALRPRNKMYNFDETYGAQGYYTVAKKDFDDGVYLPWNAPGYLKFVGDSMYLVRTNFNDAVENWDTEVWEFKGRRN